MTPSGYMTLGCSNWTICSLLNRFCTKNSLIYQNLLFAQVAKPNLTPANAKTRTVGKTGNLARNLYFYQQYGSLQQRALSCCVSASNRINDNGQQRRRQR